MLIDYSPGCLWKLWYYFFLPNLFWQYVASNTVAEEIEILLVRQNEVLCILEGHETLGELQAMYGVTQRDTVSYLLCKFGVFSMQFHAHGDFWMWQCFPFFQRFAYRLKVPASMNSLWSWYMESRMNSYNVDHPRKVNRIYSDRKESCVSWFSQFSLILKVFSVYKSLKCLGLV